MSRWRIGDVGFVVEVDDMLVDADYGGSGM